MNYDRSEMSGRNRQAVCVAAGSSVDVIIDDRGLRRARCSPTGKMIGVPHRIVGRRAWPKEGTWNTRAAAIPKLPRCQSPAWWTSSRANWASDKQQGSHGARRRHRAGGACSTSANVASAGNQKEEAMDRSVRLALSNAIKDARPPKPVFRDEASRLALSALAGADVRPAQTQDADDQSRTEFLEAVWYDRAGPGSTPAWCRPDPGRIGVPQVRGVDGRRARLHASDAVLGESHRRQRPRKYSTCSNLRYGCSILRMYIDMEKGNLYLALGRYNGSRGRPKYPNAVLGAEKWEFHE